MFTSSNKRRIAAAAVGLVGVLGLASQTVLAAAPATGPALMLHLLDPGCRIVDTRSSTPVGPVSGNVEFAAVGADLSLQGGSVDGCSIPVAAQAVEVSLSTVGGSPNRSGFLKAGAATDPGNTVLQFGSGQGTSVTTTIALSGTDTFFVKVNGATASTNIVVDAVGYWATS